MLALTLALSPGTRAEAQIPSAELQRLRTDIVTGRFAGSIDAARHGELPRYRAALLRIYSDSVSAPLWSVHGQPSPQARALLEELRDADERGLDPADYDADLLARVFQQLPASDSTNANDLVLLRADAQLSLALMLFVDHARSGRVDPRLLGFVLPAERARADLAASVASLSHARDLHSALDSLEPPYSRFRALERLLRRYRALATDPTLGVLPKIQASIRPSDRWSGCPELRRLLRALGDSSVWPGPVAARDSDVYGLDLVRGVKRFQSSRGLSSDGVIGKATLGALRGAIAFRTAQIELTMERWRWLPDPAATRLLVVNIPEFRIYAIERKSGRVQTSERTDVIVGSAYNGRRTPVLASSVRYVIFHPYWDVPPSIARREEIPKILRDPGYATREGMEIVRGADAGALRYPITPENLQRVRDGILRLRQRPGPRNALGAVKFVFPNRYNVYLHDTPQQSLFASERRDFSHGCIRAGDPEGVAEFVLSDEEGWGRTRIGSSIAGSSSFTVTLKHPVPIFIVYDTVVANVDGTSSFLADVYGHDAALARALERRAR